MDLAKLIILFQCSAIGMAVSFLLIALLIRQKNTDSGTQIGIALGVCVFGMYAGICEFTICGYYALPIPTWTIRLLVWILSFLPALIILSWRKSRVLRWESKISTCLVAAAFISGFAIVVISHGFGPKPNMSQPFVRILAMQRALCLAPAIVSILRLPLDSRLRTFIKATTFAYLGASSINVIRTPGLSYTSPYGLILMFIAQGCVLWGVLGSFIVMASFRLVDVFLRWSTRITILGVLSLIGSLSFVLVGNNVSASFRTVGFLVCSVELVVLLLFGMSLTERCERWVDSHVLQRLDLKTEAARMQNELFNIDRREDLFSFIETELTQRLDVREVRIVPRSSVPRKLLTLESANNAPLEVNSSNMSLQVGMLKEVDVLVPIPSHGKTEEMIGVSTGAGRRSMNSGEIGFLKDLGHDLGARLHQLEVEAAHRRQVLRETLLRQQLTEAELRALRAQVNPHFLFNSLNTIVDLIVRAPAKAERMTLRLSSVFRHVLTQSDRQFVNLSEEFSFLRNYLDIEQERFGENLQVSFELEPQVADVSVPTLLLQPLVENALRHGLAPKGGKRSLRIVAAGSTDGVVLEVIDNGIGFPSTDGRTPMTREKKLNSGVGLTNTRARLRAVYGAEGRLVIESVPMQGSRVSLLLPKQEVVA